MSDGELWSRSELTSAAQELDGVDGRILADVAQLFTAADPVPERLVERLRFAVALDEVMAEVAELSRVSAPEPAVRAEAGTERAETITFTARSLTAMIAISGEADAIRVDGWITPPGATGVRLRSPGGERQTRSDETGRFGFEDVPSGLSQLLFTGLDPDVVVATPVFEIEAGR